MIEHPDLSSELFTFLTSSGMETRSEFGNKYDSAKFYVYSDESKHPGNPHFHVKRNNIECVSVRVYIKNNTLTSEAMVVNDDRVINHAIIQFNGDFQMKCRFADHWSNHPHTIVKIAYDADGTFYLRKRS